MRDKALFVIIINCKQYLFNPYYEVHPQTDYNVIYKSKLDIMHSKL